VNGTWNITGGPFSILANINHDGAFRQTLVNFSGPDLTDARLHICSKFRSGLGA